VLEGVYGQGQENDAREADNARLVVNVVRPAAPASGLAARNLGRFAVELGRAAAARERRRLFRHPASIGEGTAQEQLDLSVDTP
jgi:hypothetical protein